MLCNTRDTLMSFVSRRRMYAPLTLCEVASVNHPVSVALFSICQLENLSKTPHSGLQESRSLRAKETLATRRVEGIGSILEEAPHLHQTGVLQLSAETFRRVRPVSTPTLVPPVFSFIMNRYSISSAKLGIIALVC
jgi:hypothetical protein